jgi:hypothetical protein
MMAAIQRDRNNGSRKGAHADRFCVTGKLGGIGAGVFTISAIYWDAPSSAGAAGLVKGHSLSHHARTR